MQNPLEKILIDQINAHGPLSLGRFMGSALGHPDYGYYMTRDPFGVEGDFTTAPEISQMFGEMIGAWVVDTWRQFGEPQLNLVECGPGRGTLMADILRVASKVEGFLSATSIYLMEMSPVLKQAQKSALHQYDVTWVNQLDDVQGSVPCIVIGNEFLDALPVEHLTRTEQGWKQAFVGFNEDRFEQVLQKPESGLVDILPSKTESHQTYEVSPERNAFIDQCSSRIAQDGGAGLFVDYGYIRRYHGNTIQAVRAHKKVDVYQNVGLCDITAHVDFDALCDIAQKHCSVSPVITQREFLRHIGIEHRAKVLRKVAQSSDDIDVALKRLIDVDQMGDLFKVMMFYAEINRS